MSKERRVEDFSNFGYDFEFVEFMSLLHEEISSGVKFNKENLGRRIETYNKKHSADLRADQLLFGVIDNEMYVLAERLYPIVMKDLKIEESTERNSDNREAIISEIEVLKMLHQDLKDKYCPEN